MADNRFYLYCSKCKDIFFIGKCLHDCGIYHVQTDYSVVLEEIYSWMKKHLEECYGDRFYKGEIFKVLTEYDKRVEKAMRKNENR